MLKDNVGSFRAGVIGVCRCLTSYMGEGSKIWSLQQALLTIATSLQLLFLVCFEEPLSLFPIMPITNYIPVNRVQETIFTHILANMYYLWSDNQNAENCRQWRLKVGGYKGQEADHTIV